MRAWLQILRLALLPTVLFDLLAGALLAGQPLTVALWPAVIAVVCLYHAGMVLNDWADRAHDRMTRPGRPIPSGRVSSAAALAAGLALWSAGLAAGWFGLASDGRKTTLALAAIVLVYNLAGRTVRHWFGPPLLAVARGCSLALGMLATVRFDELGQRPFAIMALAAYSCYFLLTARLASYEESGIHGQRAVVPILGAAACPLLLTGASDYSPLLFAGLAALAAWLIWPLRRDALAHWPPERVQRAVRRGLAGAPLVPACALLAAGSWPWAAIAPLVSISVMLLARRWPPE